MWDNLVYVFLWCVEDDGEVEVAVGAVVSAGAGAEGDDLERVGCFDDAANGLSDLFVSDGPVELDGFVGHLFPLRSAAVCLM